MFEDLRQKLTLAYKTLHDVAYPTLPVNYPDRAEYNPEGSTAPFVVIYFEISPKQLELGSRSMKVDGSMNVTYFYRPGSGPKGSAQFSDFLLDKIGLRAINGIVFNEVTPYYDAGMAGWEGTLNVIPFRTDYHNI